MTGDSVVFGRVEASASGIVNVPAEEAWIVLTDWGGFPMRAKMPGVLGVVLAWKDTLPTRCISFANGAAVTEVLLHKDDEAHRLYCRTIDDGAAPWRNYLATLIVDASDARQCRITVHGWCDVKEPGSADAIKPFLEQSWAEGIIAGVGRALDARVRPDVLDDQQAN